ncbi:Rhodanese-like domain-containing protein [Pilobolus umbonatus]|nr:Rhodanese-like domain-containing protein [Pilobolus umbonatus]
MTIKLKRKITNDLIREKQQSEQEWLCCTNTFTLLSDIYKHVNNFHSSDMDKRVQIELTSAMEMEEKMKNLSMLKQRRGLKGSSDPISIQCNCSSEDYKVILFYRYAPVDDPIKIALDHQVYCQAMTGKVKIAKEGINATLAGTNADIDTYLNWLTQTQLFQELDHLKEHIPLLLTDKQSPRYKFFKPSHGCIHVFSELSIKVVDEICPLGQSAVVLDELSKTNHRQGKLSPEDFHRELCKRKDEGALLLDTRNYYESKIGHFEGAIKPAIRKFSQFPDYIERNKEVLQGKKILTYCTGGIRCEKATAYMRQALPENTEIYMLDGGIHNYMEWWNDKKETDPVWQGKNYVFDARQSLGFNHPESNTVVGQCQTCGSPWDKYTKCASAGCHLLVLECDRCVDPSSIVYCCTECKETEGKALCLCEKQRRKEEHEPLRA